MNLGFFVETNAGTPENTSIYNFLNSAIENNELTDATVFFNDVGFNPVATKFGMLDGADMWSFSGNLVCTSIENLRRASSIVNDIKTAYLFSSKESIETHIYDFVAVSKLFKVIVNNIVDQNTFYRLTGVKPNLIEEWSVPEIEGVFNG